MVDNPYSLNQTPIFELNVVRCGFKNAYQNDMCMQDIGLRAQNIYSRFKNQITWRKTYIAI